MKVLVTGAAGFIGFHVTKKLYEMGHEVVAFDNLNEYYDVQLKISRLKELGFDQGSFDLNSTVVRNDRLSFIRGDLENYELLSEIFLDYSFDRVIHMAAQAGVRYSIEAPFSYVRSNLVGFANILEACRHFRVQHLVYASSSSIYGNINDVPFKESQKTDKPISLYAATKKSNELLAHAYSTLYQIQTTGLRFFTVYGPWGRPDMAPMLFASAIADNKPINVFNEGEMQRDFTYIDDVVHGIVKTMDYRNKDKIPFRIFNIGNSSPIHLMDFIKLMEKSMGRKAALNMMPMQPGDVKITYASTENLKKATGYSPNTSLRDGIITFVAWYKKYYNLKD